MSSPHDLVALPDPLLTVAANDQLSPVLLGHIESAPAGALEVPVLQTWGRRDPVDAALDARLLLQRLKRGERYPHHDGAHRPFVDQVQLIWAGSWPPDVYLAAAERLEQVMTAWADADLAAVIEPASNTA